jgi:hypothetical protein
MDGGQGAVEPHSSPQLFERQVRLAAQEHSPLLVMTRHDEGFASGEAVARRYVSSASALLQKLFDHAQRNPVATGCFFTVSLLLVVGAEDSFTQVQGYCSHERTLTPPPTIGYSFI